MKINIWILCAVLVIAVVAALTQMLIINKRAINRFGKMFIGYESDAKYMLFQLGFITCAYIVGICLVEMLGQSIMVGKPAILPINAVVFLSVVLYAALLVRYNISDVRIVKIVKTALITACVITVLEVFLFNAKSICDVTDIKVLDQKTLTFDEDMAKFNDDGQIVVKDNNTTVDTGEVDEVFRAVTITTSREGERALYHLVLQMKDDNFADRYVDVADRFIGGGKSITFTFDPYGYAHDLRFKFYQMDGNVTIESITLLSASPYGFSLVRVMAIFIVVMLVVIIRVFDIAAIRFDRENKRHRIAQFIVSLMCVSSALLFISPNYKWIEYPWDGNANGLNPYAQTFDAFMKGQTNLDLPVDEKLAEMTNPYDNSLRASEGVSSKWDRAYYEGKYYSYFGIAPVLLFHYPCYFIAGVLPDNGLMTVCMAIICIMFICLTIDQVVKRFVKKPNLLLMLLMYPTVTAVSGVYYTLTHVNMYDVAIISALMFLYMALYYGFLACDTETGGRKYCYLLLSGLAVGMCVLSRPSTALIVLMLTPLYIELLLKKNKYISVKLAEAAVFLVPALIGCAVLLVYNKLRFGSFTEFGTNYQLTVSDVHANHLSLAYIVDTFASYFLQFPCVRAAFPFIEMRTYNYANYGKYVYADHNFGLFMIPVILMGMLLIKRALKKETVDKNSGNTLFDRSFVIISLALMIFVAWMDFCMAGINMRYVMDITTPAVIVSIIAILRTTKNRQSFQYSVVLASMVLSIALIVAMILSERGGSIARIYPEMYDRLEDLIVFWR